MGIAFSQTYEYTLVVWVIHVHDYELHMVSRVSPKLLLPFDKMEMLHNCRDEEA
jgi:hypothetical protein